MIEQGVRSVRASESVMSAQVSEYFSLDQENAGLYMYLRPSLEYRRSPRLSPFRPCYSIISGQKHPRSRANAHKSGQNFKVDSLGDNSTGSEEATAGEASQIEDGEGERLISPLSPPQQPHGSAQSARR